MKVYMVSSYDFDDNCRFIGVFDSYEKSKECCNKVIKLWFDNYTDDDDRNDYKVIENEINNSYEIIDETISDDYLELGLTIDEYVLNSFLNEGL